MLLQMSASMFGHRQTCIRRQTLRRFHTCANAERAAARLGEPAPAASASDAVCQAAAADRPATAASRTIAVSTVSSAGCAGTIRQ